MSEQLAQVVLVALAGHLAVGIVVAGAIHAHLVRLDPSVRAAGLAFRALITPGLIALWPLVLLRWRRGAERGPTPRALRRAHLRIVTVLAVLLPIALALVLATRPLEPQPQRLPAALGG